MLYETEKPKRNDIYKLTKLNQDQYLGTYQIEADIKSLPTNKSPGQGLFHTEY